MAKINQGKTMTGHDWPRIFVSYLQVHREGLSGARVTTDRSLPLPGAKQAENVAAKAAQNGPEETCLKEIQEG